MRSPALIRFGKNRGAIVGLFLVLFVLCFAYGAPLLSEHSPLAPDFDAGRGPFGTPRGPSGRHWLGTDTIFRDVLVRLAFGGQLSLEVALTATALSIAIGTTVGIVSGYFQGTRLHIFKLCIFGAGVAMSIGLLRFAIGQPAKGALVTAGVLALFGLLLFIAHRALATAAAQFALDIDTMLMALVDVMLAFPFLLLLMALSAAIERTSELTVTLVLGLTAWAACSRVIRAKTLQIRELDFVAASRALGQSTGSILLRHVLPNVMSTVVVLATNSVAAMIIAEAALSFLGLSLPAPTPSWGRMLDEGRQYYAMAPWLLLAPAAAILVSVVGFNLLGDGIRDAFDASERRA